MYRYIDTLIYQSMGNKMNVSYLGQPGSYSYIAAQKYFGENISGIGKESLTEVFTSVKNGEIHQGIVPVENSLIGSIYETYDLLEKTKLNIIGELYSKINFHLLTKNKKAKLQDIKKVYVFYKTYEQCRKFLQAYPDMKIEFTKDNGSSAKLLKEAKADKIAAISSAHAASLYGLTVLKQNVDDHADNYTRFLIVSGKPNKGGDKVTMQLTLQHVPGSLHTALGSLAKNNINVTKIESRPLVGTPWEYLFYIDIETNSKWEESLKEMNQEVESLTILGTYMKGKVYET